jgi:mannose/fructose/N-acetylgalactosamine-specific phosphotransferase system component IIB
VVPFNKGKILYIVGTIEDKIAAYYQNISIAQLNDGASSNPASHRKEKSDVEIDQTSHDKM